MLLASLFHAFTKPVQNTPPQPSPAVQIAQDQSNTPARKSEPIQTKPNQSAPICTEISFPAHVWLFPAQLDWIMDHSILRIWEKSRQIGATKSDALDSVLKASPAEATLDVWVTSRDEAQALLYLEDCRDWAKLLNLLATYEGKVVIDKKKNCSAHVLQFANGRRIYCLSSNPNALAGKRGHVKIDEFALHPDQRALFKVAQPVTTWGGTISVMSTHRGPNSYFNQLIRDIVHNGNPMGWSHHKTTIQQAIEQGIVERINEKTGRNETRAEWEARIHRQCGSTEAWNEEYCCTPADESSAFLSHDLISTCEDPNLKLMSLDQLLAHYSQPSTLNAQLFVGMDVARKIHLCVIDVGEKIGDVMHDRARFELLNQPFSEIRRHLYPLLELPQVQRCCIDNSGNGIETAEEARNRFGSKVEPVTFTGPVKERLAFPLRSQFEDRTLRIPIDDKLRADLHAIKKETTISGNIRFVGDTDDSHCDRFWAKALRQEAARPVEEVYAIVG